jgi:protein farnesyltransferase subunit beta
VSPRTPVQLTCRRPDQYHTCNNLSGLSVAQHRVIHSPTLVNENRAKFDTSKGFPAVRPTKPEGGWASEEERQEVRRQVWASALGWVEEGEAVILGGKDSRVVSVDKGRAATCIDLQNTTAPVFNILLLRLKPFINYFYGQTA